MVRQNFKDFSVAVSDYINAWVTHNRSVVQDEGLSELVSDVVLFYIYYCSHRATSKCTDLSLSEHLATQLYLSGTQDVPYEEALTSSAITNVCIKKARIPVVSSLHPDPTILESCILIDMDRIGSNEFEPLMAVIRASYGGIQKIEKSGLSQKYLFIITALELESNTTFLTGMGSVYRSLEGAFYTVNFENTEFDELVATGSILGTDEVVPLSEGLYSAQESNVELYNAFGIALDMAFKAIILNRLGDFRGETREYSTPHSRQLASKKVTPKRGKKKTKPRRVTPYAVTYMQSSDVPWIPPEEAAEALEREIDQLNAELQRLSPNTRNHYKMIWVVERYIQQHRIPQSDIYAEDESRPRRNRYGDLVFKKRYLIKRLYTFDSSNDDVLDTPNIHVKRLSNRTNPYNAVHELTFGCELDPYEVREFMEEHYPHSVSSPDKFLEDHPEPLYKYYHSADFTWIGIKGRMLRLQPNMEDRIHPVEGNIFDDEKLCAIADAPSVYDFKIPFICGYCEVYTMDCESVLSAMSYNDYDYYEPDADDVGEVHIQLRDGNHRTIGALASGNDAYVFISDNQYQDYEAWIAKGKPRHALYEWLDDNLI